MPTAHVTGGIIVLPQNGWLTNVRRISSPHYDSRPPNCAINLLVIHGISLPSGVFGGDEIRQLFCGSLNCNQHSAFASLKNLRVSAHFLIRRDGELIQFVSCDHRAWHAGESHWQGRDNCNDLSIGIELEGTDDIPYDDAQYDALTPLILALNKLYTPLQIVGHQHIAPHRKTDPGSSFNWQQLFNHIGEDYDGRVNL